MNQKHAWNIITVFLLLIFGFSAATLVVPKKDFSEKENRSLQKMPALQIDEVLNGRFEEQYEDYLTDQFPGRNSWIRVRTAADRLMQRQDVHDVYFAEDDYLIEKHSGVFNSDLAQLQARRLGSFFEQLQQAHPQIQASCIIAPNALEICSELLPAGALKGEEHAYLQSIEEALPRDVWFDSEAVLRDNKEQQLYYRTDHHWTSEAAFAVFKEWAGQNGLTINEADYERDVVTEAFQGTVCAKVGVDDIFDTIARIQKKDPAGYLLTYNQTDDVRSTAYQEQKLQTRSKYDYFYGGNFGLVEGKTEAKTGRRILVIKDSYAHCFVPLLYDYFDTVDMVDLRYFTQSLSEWIEGKNYTDVLVLMNAAGLAEDASLSRICM